MSAETFVRLLDVEPDLAARLREDDRAEAREALVLRVVTVPERAWTLAGQSGRGHPFGLVVLEGLLLQQVEIGGRHALQLIGPGDLVLPQGSTAPSLGAAPTWTAAVPTRVAILDDRLQRSIALWPGLGLSLLERVGRQLARASVHSAIAQLPRVDQRLEATFWELADRWGRVTPSGVAIPLQLTHEVLARLVGGRRPTISLALTELAQRGVVIRRPDRSWLLTCDRPSLPLTPHHEAPTELVAPTAPPAQPPAPDPHWRREAIHDLLATAERARQEHEAHRARLAANLGASQENRRRSEVLRAYAADARTARARTRDARVSPADRPRPSAG